jgi:soluble lytic murein transglycosylase-like protein
MDRTPIRALWVVIAGAALWAAAPAVASAQVIEVGPDGVFTRNGPAVTTSAGVTPIAPVRPQRAAGRPSEERLASAAPLLTSAGREVQLSPQLLEAVAYVESRLNHSARSPAGAVGMMQLMPATAADLGVDPHDPASNVRGGANYLRQMLAMFDNNVELALAAYNAGPQAVIRHGGVPPYPETRAYVAAVLDYMARSSVSE